MTDGRSRVATTARRGSRRVPSLLYTALLIPMGLGALASMPRRWAVGPTSGLAALTVAQVGLVLFGVVALGRAPKRIVTVFLPYLGFMLSMLFSVAWAPPDIEGIQNGLVYILFGVSVLLAGALATFDPERMSAVVARGVSWISGITLAIVVIQLAVYGLPVSVEAFKNSPWYVTPRSISMVLMLALSWHLSRWYCGNTRSAAICLAVLAGQAATLSRMATATGAVLIAIMMLLQARFRPARMMKNLPLLIGIVVTIVALALYYEPVRRRIFTGDTSIQVGGVKVNASGRMDFWRITIASASVHPVLGRGLGSAERVISAQYSGDVGHPHNDYLRLWHDLGLVGVGLFVLALGRWLSALYRTWYRSERRRTDPAVDAMAALLALLGLMAIMLTDNAIVYPFVMGPLGIMIGTGLGHGLASRQTEADSLGHEARALTRDAATRAVRVGARS